MQSEVFCLGLYMLPMKTYFFGMMETRTGVR